MKKQPHILVLGDHSDLKAPVETLLVESTHLQKNLSSLKITHQRDVQDVYSQLRTGRVDVIVLGTDLKEKHGREFLEDLGEHAPETPVIVLCKKLSQESLLSIERKELVFYLLQEDLTSQILGEILGCIFKLKEAKVAMGKSRHTAEKRLAEFQALRQATLHLTSTLELQPVLDAILESAMSLIPADDAHIFLYDGGKLSFGAALFDGEQQKEPYASTRPEGVTNTVAQSGEIIVVNNVMEDPLFDNRRWDGAILSMPLKIRKEVLGVMNVAFEQPHVFSKDELRLLGPLGDQAAIAIHNAHLYEQAQQEITERKRAEAALKESERNYKKLFESMSSAFAVHEIILNEEGDPYNYQFLEVNPAFKKLINREGEKLIGKTILDVLPGIGSYWIKRFGWVAKSGEPTYFEDYSKELGKYYAAHVYSPQPGRFATLFSDLSARKTVEEALRKSEEKYRMLFERVPVGLYRTTPEGKILEANPAMVKMLGYSDRESLLEVEAIDLYVNPEDRKQEQALLEKNDMVQNFETQVYRKDGSVIWVRDTARVIRDDGGSIFCYQGSLVDITERKQMQESIQYMATHDALTGLPNRRLFNDRIDLEIAHARRNQQKLGILLFDLDGFKKVNDGFGHNVGDKCIKNVAQVINSLKRCVRAIPSLEWAGMNF